MASGKRASMREGPLAALFRRTDEEGEGGQETAPETRTPEAAAAASAPTPAPERPAPEPPAPARAPEPVAEPPAPEPVAEAPVPPATPAAARRREREYPHPSLGAQPEPEVREEP